ncbi:MAG TPA: metallophosphoesterase [Candidatus Dormibacteraeota bacterium]|nr:metallophosphoesterase [Candidatus Dormibacteraeota bacterium]
MPNRGERALRIFFATDIHGSERCFRKFLAAAKAYEADALILGGDIVGKGLVPIREQNGSLTATVRGDSVTVPREDGERLRAEINQLGFYSVIGGDDEVRRIETDREHREAVFSGEIRKQVEAWCELAAERLPDDVRCVITPGNDDPREIDAVLKAAPRIDSPEGELFELGPVLLASCGDVTPTPWNTEREYSEEELSGRLTRMLDAAPAGARVVANFHNPPYSSGLDFAAELDRNLLPVLRGGRPSIIPVGSKAVREAIRRYQPVVGLHGHIHESKGAQKIGATMCLNPGSDYSADVLRGAIVDIAADGSFMDFLFTAG